MTFTVNPVAVDTGVENVGVNAAPCVAVPVTVADPDAYPALVVATLTVDDTPGANPVTVNGRTAPLTVPFVTVPVLPAAIVGVNVYAGSKFVTFTVNPVAVDTGVENVGVNAAPCVAVPVTVADPDAYPALVVATLTVDDTPPANPVTVNGRTAPLTVPFVTTPALPAAIDGVNV